MIKTFLLTIFFLNSFISVSQSEPAIHPLPKIITAGTGGYHNDCNENSYAQLHLNDSTTVKFNEFSTFEMRLNFQKANLKLDSGMYMVSYYSENFGIIAVDSFYYPIDVNPMNYTVSFDSLICCHSFSISYLLYEDNQVDPSPCSCLKPEFILTHINIFRPDSLFIAGIYDDSTSTETAFKRAENMKNDLISKGYQIPITTRTTKRMPEDNILFTNIVISPESSCYENWQSLNVGIKVSYVYNP